MGPQHVVEKSLKCRDGHKCFPAGNETAADGHPCKLRCPRKNKGHARHPAHPPEPFHKPKRPPKGRPFCFGLEIWWSQGGSNSRPLECHSHILRFTGSLGLAWSCTKLLIIMYIVSYGHIAYLSVSVIGDDSVMTRNGESSPKPSKGTRNAQHEVVSQVHQRSVRPGKTGDLVGLRSGWLWAGSSSDRQPKLGCPISARLWWPMTRFMVSTRSSFWN